MVSLRDADSGEILLKHLEIADTFWTRFKGLQFREPLPPDRGVLIVPCSSLHTCFMRFPIDVIMLDQERVVVDVRKNLKPWRTLFCHRSTTQILETHAGSLDLSSGTRLDWGGKVLVQGPFGDAKEGPFDSSSAEPIE